jgi:cell wall-associated NlpC family hydrolase
MFCACSHFKTESRRQGNLEAARRTIECVRHQRVPDPHLEYFNIGVERVGNGLVLTGEVVSAESKASTLRALQQTGVNVEDRVQVWPMGEFGNEDSGVACLSVATGRELPDHKAEMAMQVLMGHSARIWGAKRNWYLVQSPDGYFAWIERGAMERCTRTEIESWESDSLVIVTAFEDVIREAPGAAAASVSDVVMGDLVKKVSEQDDWLKVELPDRRTGYLPKKSGEPFAEWKTTRRPSGENIERAGRLFIGRPYLWGGNSPKGFDCSGFTKFVFFLNGVELNRNASQQALQGQAVPITADFSHLKKGDLLFFGRRPRGSSPEMVTHVAIYLGDKLFIQSSEQVKISSLDPDSPIRDEHHLRNLLFARRILKETREAEHQE